MIFRRLDPEDEQVFRESARKAVTDARYASGVAGVSNGKVEIDIELYHPVWLEEFGLVLVEHARSRMGRVQ